MQTEQAYQRSEGRLAGILDIAEDAIIVANINRTITLFNQGAVRLFGYDADGVLGHSLDLLLPERFREEHSRHIEAFTHSPETARRMAQRRDVFGFTSGLAKQLPRGGELRVLRPRRADAIPARKLWGSASGTRGLGSSRTGNPKLAICCLACAIVNSPK